MKKKENAKLNLELQKECNICKHKFVGNENKLICEDSLRIFKQKFNLIICPKCSSYVLNPKPIKDDLPKLYGSNFLYKEKFNKKNNLYKLAKIIQNFNNFSELTWIKKYISKQDKWIDISAGNGQFIKEIIRFDKKKKLNISFFATEFTNDLCNLLKAEIPNCIVKKSINDFKEQKFNFISLFGVIDHMENPELFISQIPDFLLMKGKLMLTMVNVDSWQKNIFNENWFSWLAPRHIYLMPMKEIESLLKKNGLRVIDKKYYFHRTASATLVLSIFPKLNPLVNKNLLALIIYGLFFYLFIPFELFAALFKKGAFMGVVAEKI